MKRKTIIILLALTIVLFSISSVCASDADDIAVSSEDDSQMGLSTQMDNDDETLTEENTQEILSASEGTYFDLKNEIGDGGNKNLTKSYYRYSGEDETIIITSPGVIDGKGAVIDMEGSLNLNAFYVNVTGMLTIKNLTIKNVNSYGEGGAIFFLNGNATITDCNFYNNSAQDGGAIYFNGTESSDFITVENCIFTNNTAIYNGGAIDLFLYGNFTAKNCIFINNKAAGYMDSGGEGGAISTEQICDFINIYNCEFTNNTAAAGTVEEGPFWMSSGGAIDTAGNVTTITDSKFNNNYASMGGAVCLTWGDADVISNCNFTGNSALYAGAFENIGCAVTIINSIFDSNKAVKSAGAISNDEEGLLCIRECNFIGNNAGSASAIYNEHMGELTSALIIEDSTFTNNGGSDDHSIYNDGNLTLSGNTLDNIIYNNGIITSTTNAIVLANKTVDAKCGETVKLNATLTDDNGNLIEDENLQFTVDGAVVPVKSSYANGVHTATYIPDKVGQKVVSVDLDYDTTVKTATIIVNIVETKLSANAVTTVYNVAKNLVVTLKDAYGNAISNAKITINLNGKSIKVNTDKNGQAKLAIKLPAKKYTATIIYDGDDSHIKSTTTANVVVKKASPKIIAKKKTFKAKTKIKKYIITLKDNKGKAFKKAKVTLKVKGKTYKAITNSKGKATFKITKLTKKGKYKATVKYSGNKNFKAVAKTVKYISVKK